MVHEPPPVPPHFARNPHAEALLEVEHLTTSFFTRGGVVPVVRDVSFTLRRGEVLGLVGESGSGKSVTARSIMNLVPSPGRIVDGTVSFKGRDLTKLSQRELRQIRGAEMSMVLQEPMTSLNPVLTIGSQVAEMFEQHRDRLPEGRTIRDAVVDILQQVRIPDAARRQKEYPIHFSGGMRQRVSIAMAAACGPELIIADEPTTALDVTIQAQVLDLLLELRETLHTSLLFITHDLGVVAQVCDTVAVMYAGQIVEYADVHTLFESPQHPYTQGLLRSLPKLDRRRDRLPSIAGQPPSMTELPEGCPFTDRCEFAHEQCREQPPLFQVMPGFQGVSQSRCWLHVEGPAHRERAQ